MPVRPAEAPAAHPPRICPTLATRGGTLGRHPTDMHMPLRGGATTSAAYIPSEGECHRGNDAGKAWLLPC